ncbi:MAG TPA: argininosuccinate lyase [Albidovulum sp.]|uniref:argininosuccinate lyase n=1 Tax=Albidovulum sp. TaxID=1872424 RepID=UPI002C350751|nr:argininosuccinate lyase [Albidovulum sp.]
MKRILAALGLLSFLAACGVDGAPVPPEPKPKPPSAVAISGDARIGIVAKL